MVLKEFLTVNERKDSKRPSDPAKDKRREKKYAARLKPLRLELQVQTDALVAALLEFKDGYLDWMEPLLNQLVQLQPRHPKQVVDGMLCDSSLKAMRKELRFAREGMRRAFAKTSSHSWDQLVAQGIDAFMDLPIAVKYFQRFAEQERVSESFNFYVEVKKFKDYWQHSSRDANASLTSIAASEGQEVSMLPQMRQARHIVAVYLEEGCKQEINVPQSLKLAAIKAAKDPSIITENVFDKCFDTVCDMLEETFQHFLQSPLAKQLSTRLERIVEHHSVLKTMEVPIPTLSEIVDASSGNSNTSGTGVSNGNRSGRGSSISSSMGLSDEVIEPTRASNSTDWIATFEESPPAYKRRPRSGSASQPTTRGARLKRTASSGVIEADSAISRSDKSRESPSPSAHSYSNSHSGNPLAAEPSSPSSSERSNESGAGANGSSSMRTASRAYSGPLALPTSTLRTTSRDGRDTFREVSPGSSSRDNPPSPAPSARGIRNIISTLSTILTKNKKKYATMGVGTNSQGLSGEEKSASAASLDDLTVTHRMTHMSLATQQANELGSLATRQLCLLSTHLSEMVNNNYCADFIILCGPDETIFYGHSVVFAARWPIFIRENPKLLGDIARGGTQPEVEMPTTDPDIFALALEYLYTGTFTCNDLSDRKLGVLTDFAKFRKVPGLKELANSYLLSRQPTSSIVSQLVEYVQSSHATGEMLRLDTDAKYESFIATLAARAQDLVDLSLFNFHQLQRLRRIDMVHLIRRDDFSVASELSVCKLVSTWADKVSPSQDVLMENLSFLVAHVRLPLMTMEELQWIDTLGWVPPNLMREAFKFKETGVAVNSMRGKARKSILIEPGSFKTGGADGTTPTSPGHFQLEDPSSNLSSLGSSSSPPTFTFSFRTNARNSTSRPVSDPRNVEVESDDDSDSFESERSHHIPPTETEPKRKSPRARKEKQRDKDHDKDKEKVKEKEKEKEKEKDRDREREREKDKDKEKEKEKGREKDKDPEKEKEKEKALETH